jgi:type VI secretion system protein ImpA
LTVCKLKGIVESLRIAAGASGRARELRLEALVGARMAEIDIVSLISPISESEPCGPDLDLAGDPDYMNFVARAEGVFPASFFSNPEGRPFDRTSIDFAAELAAIKPLLARTRDIRLLTILAKLYILNRDLEGFENVIHAIRELLSERWDDVHPRGDNGVFSARMAAVDTLDDLVPVILPLQYAPLVRDPRVGDISYRTYMIASGEVPARDGEDAHDLTTFEGAMDRVELGQLVQTLARINALRTALSDIRHVSTERAGFEYAAKLERLPELVDKMRSLLNGIVAKRDPSVALETDPAGKDAEAATDAPAASGEVRSLADVADALAAVAEYFSRREPSNPALLLVRQAEQLMGKSFFEIMQVLVPTYVEQAAFHIGADQALQLPLQRLSEFGFPSAPSSADGEEDGTSPQRQMEARTRAEALRLLEQTAKYYRAAEPSSPLPHLIDRARELSGRDFLSVLKHVLPEAAFTSKTEGN